MTHRPAWLGQMCGVRGFDCITNVFAIAVTDLTDKFSFRAQPAQRVRAVGANLLAADIHLRGAVDARPQVTPIGALCRGHRRTRRDMFTPPFDFAQGGFCPFSRRFEIGTRAFHPDRPEVFEQTFLATFATESRFAIAAESRSAVKLIRA